jgi:hypothetical protein
MNLNTGQELSDVPNPKIKPVRQKRKQSHVEIRNDYDNRIDSKLQSASYPRKSI